MKKVKLSKQAVTDLVYKCRAKNDEKRFTIPVWDTENPGKVNSIEISYNSIGENREEIRYLLGQLAVFHTNNKIALYEQMAFLHTGENWTENDPVVLRQLMFLGIACGFVGAVERTEINGKKVDFSNLNPLGVEKRIKPVIHE